MNLANNELIRKVFFTYCLVLFNVNFVIQIAVGQERVPIRPVVDIVVLGCKIASKRFTRDERKECPKLSVAGRSAV